MKYETTMLLRYQRKEHPIVTDIIKKMLAAALETDASADEVKTACRLTERIISESAPSPLVSEFADKEIAALVSEFADKEIAALDALEEVYATGFSSSVGIFNEPRGED